MRTECAQSAHKMRTTKRNHYIHLNIEEHSKTITIQTVYIQCVNTTLES